MIDSGLIKTNCSLSATTFDIVSLGLSHKIIVDPLRDKLVSLVHYYLMMQDGLHKQLYFLNT